MTIDKSYTGWVKAKKVYFSALGLMIAIFVISLILRLLEVSTGLVITIVILGSGIAILIMSLWIIWYLLNMVKPGGKRK